MAGENAGLTQDGAQRKVLQVADDACDERVDARILAIRTDVLFHGAPEMIHRVEVRLTASAARARLRPAFAARRREACAV